MRSVAEDTASSRAIIGECTQKENGVNATYDSVLNVGSSGSTVGLNDPGSIGAIRGVGGAEERSASPVDRGRGGDENPVIRSAVMLEFGAHMPGHAASACGKTVQFPIPDEWDNPEVRMRIRSRAFFRDVFSVAPLPCVTVTMGGARNCETKLSI